MGDSTDPAKQQYFIFSVIIAIFLALFINFFFVNYLEGTLFYGFPISLEETSGITAFFYRVINSIVYGLVLSVPVYYGIMWLASKSRY